MTAGRRCWGLAALLGAAAYLRHQGTAFAVGQQAAARRATSLAQGSECLAGGQPAVPLRSLVQRLSRGGFEEGMPNFDLTGKVALVTGASRGIGLAIADQLAAAGATVIGTATSEKGAEAISARLASGKGVKLDVASQEDIKTVLAAIKEEFGSPDILVNNAGIVKDGLMMRMKEKDWDEVIKTDLKSVFTLSQAVVKDMSKKRWGRIISLSSIVGATGNAGQVNYCAAKAGVDGFSRALAREVATRGITVNTVAPALIKTDMIDALKDEWKTQLLSESPMGRFGDPKDIAYAVLFLAAPAGNYLTGQTIHVNGGMFMK